MSSTTPSTILSSHFTDAVGYARDLFAVTARKDSDIAYMSHLLSVAALVLEYGGDEDQTIAALLHDAAEDFGGEPRLADIDREFGADVRDIVAACSDSLTENPNEKPPWWERKTAYLARLEHEPGSAQLVSCADKLHNARCVLQDYRYIDEQLWTRFNKAAGRKGTLWYYRRLSEIFADSPDVNSRLSDELARTVDELLRVVAEHLGAAVDLEAEYREALEMEAKCRKAAGAESG